jgi:hypothetical protein
MARATVSGMFDGLRHVGSDREFAGLDIVDARFTGCRLSQSTDPGFGLVVRDVTVRHTRAYRCAVNGVRFEDVTVDGLASQGLLRLGYCVFRHVVLRGRVGPMMTVPPPSSLPPETMRSFTSAVVDYYRDIDWALDISAAEFSDADFYFVPGDRIIRDPDTQYLLRRERIRSVELGALPPFAQIFAGRFEVTPFDTIVAIAPTRSKDFPVLRAELEKLREAGLAE